MINGQAVARNIGNVQVANAVMVGAFSNFSRDLPEAQWTNAIKALLTPKLHEPNVKAFHEGRKALK
jgi:Pyruvate/2-oxoacid:ferredoxin oxidoreductase gamma subunit